MFAGSLVALVTPMLADGSIDFDAWSRLLEFQVSNGTKGIVVAGSTGESATVTDEELRELLVSARKTLGKRALLIANAPDVHALDIEHSEHYAHWTQNFADEAGYLGDPNHVQMKVDHCHQLGITDAEILSYVPMAETIGSVYTLLYYCRRSYEEGLAAFGYARERAAGQSGYAKVLYDGLKKHYGIAAKDYEVHAYAEQQHGDKALELMRKTCITADIQRRVRQAVQHTILTNEWRTHALNRWLDA